MIRGGNKLTYVVQREKNIICVIFRSPISCCRNEEPEQPIGDRTDDDVVVGTAEEMHAKPNGLRSLRIRVSDSRR